MECSRDKLCEQFESPDAKQRRCRNPVGDPGGSMFEAMIHSTAARVERRAMLLHSTTCRASPLQQAASTPTAPLKDSRNPLR
jgi:hypothetical protein